jgi:HK97 family phage prohead protease
VNTGLWLGDDGCYLLPDGRRLPVRMLDVPRDVIYLPGGGTLHRRQYRPSFPSTRPSQSTARESLAAFGCAVPYNLFAKFDQNGVSYTFLPGAFRDIRRSVLLAFDHELHTAVASTRTGSLTLWSGPDGLYFELSRVARDAQQIQYLVEDGRITGLSIGWYHDRCRLSTIRHRRGVIHQVSDAGDALYEVSMLTFNAPRFPGTWIATPNAPDATYRLRLLNAARANEGIAAWPLA